jgi:hypothetical protein
MSKIHFTIFSQFVDPDGLQSGSGYDDDSVADLDDFCPDPLGK